MTVEMLRDFFMWCTLINWGMQLLALVMIVALGDFAYRAHSRLFPVTREQFNVTIYGMMMVMKTLVLIFNFTPWMVLLIMS